ncbi:MULTISPECIES: hypothetical protein [unclassified Microcoleus]|uniref:hypothetical protein n=1 Tax=unclassified Microcoleus TaxID=2642155 RepID=UPI002FCF8BB9
MIDYKTAPFEQIDTHLLRCSTNTQRQQQNTPLSSARVAIALPFYPNRVKRSYPEGNRPRSH